MIRKKMFPPIGILLLLMGACANIDPGKGKERVSLLYIGDIHGQFEEHPEMFWSKNGGEEQTVEIAGRAARIASAVKEIQSQNSDGTVFFDAGDTIQGSADVAVSEGEVAIPILNALDFDFAIPGNWEVVYGTKRFKEISKRLKFPFLAANIFDTKTEKRVFAPYKIIEKKGLKLAFIGFTDPDVPNRQPPTFSKGFSYKGAEILQPLIDNLRRKEHVDGVFLVTHIGLPKAVKLAETVKGVDVLFSSDTHERTYEPIVKGDTWVVEPGAFGSFLGKLDVYKSESGKLKKSWNLIELKAKDFQKDRQVLKVVKETLSPLDKKLDKVIGETKVTLARYNVIETSLDALLADALRASTGTDLAFSNGFRFAHPVVPGSIREKDLWNFFPITTPIKTGKLTGKQIKNFLEREIENVFSEDAENLFGGWLPRVSGLKVVFNSSAPAMKRVKEVLVGGQPLVEHRLYSVTTCVREGDPDTTLCRIPNGRDIEIKEFDAHEAVRKYLAKNSPIITSPALNRFIGEDLSGTVRSQYFRK